MSQQSLKPDQWIVVDDGFTPMDKRGLPSYGCYVRRLPKVCDPKHTLVVNVAEALPLIEGDRVLFWEDDEYYAPKYIEEMDKWLNQFPLVGIGWAKYYHLYTGGYIQNSNSQHASLAQTAFTSQVMPLIQKCVDMGMEKDWLDCNIWREAKKQGIRHVVIRENEGESLFVGMKGLPGRFGIGIGHNTTSYTRHDTKDREVLKKWCPKDYQIYLDLIKEGIK